MFYSEFPEDEEQGRWVLQEHAFTDVVVVGPCDVPEPVEALGLKVHQVDASEESWSKVTLPGVCRGIAQSLEGDGRVLVYSESETKAGLVVCGYRESFDLLVYPCSSTTCSNGVETHLIPSSAHNSARRSVELTSKKPCHSLVF